MVAGFQHQAHALADVHGPLVCTLERGTTADRLGVQDRASAEILRIAYVG